MPAGDQGTIYTVAVPGACVGPGQSSPHSLSADLTPGGMVNEMEVNILKTNETTYTNHASSS